MRIVVIADTHLLGGVATRLPKVLLTSIESADLLLHAGDVTTRTTLDELSSLAPMRCVLGNNDAELVGLVPSELNLALEGVNIAMIHDSGPRKGREARMSRHFPAADLVVYGHSHVADDSPGLLAQRLFNPGSPTQRRAQPFRTYGVLEVRDGIVLSRAIVSLGP
jgi:uncharacterized protein